MTRAWASGWVSARRTRIPRKRLIAAVAVGVSTGSLAFAPMASAALGRPPTPARTGGPQEMALITAGGRQIIEQGTLACTRAGEPLRVSTTVTQSHAHAAGVWSKHCKVAIHNANGNFANWKLTLKAKQGVFHAGGAVLDFVYSRGKPLKQIFHGKGEIQLFTRAAASIAAASAIPLVLAALAVFALHLRRRRRPRAT